LAQQFQRRQFLSDFLPKFLFLVTTAILVGGGIIGHNSERGPPKDHSTKVWFKLALANWAQTMVECSLGGHLSELCPTTPTANKDGHHY
jgi:hypothetical protein